MNSKKSEQVVDFNLIDEQSPTHIYSNVIKVRPSDCSIATKSNPSTKITIQRVVDYLWKDRYTLGHLITYHAHSKLMAYVLAISSSYMVRVLHEESSCRCLIKDFSGEVIDIAFSKGQYPYIASVDINGWIKVNKILITEEAIEAQLVFKIEPRNSADINRPNTVCCSRVMWCWHSDLDVNGDIASKNSEPVDNIDKTNNRNDEDTSIPNTSLLLGVIHGTSFDVIQVDTVEMELQSEILEEGKVKYNPNINRETLLAMSQSLQNQYGDMETLNELFLPYLYYTSPDMTNKITSFAISSDAAAFAVALQDGSVRFFTLDGSSKTGLKEEYQWTPFENEAVWSLLFLDDCRSGSKKDSFWCHVVVGSPFNREFRLYRCDKWDCVQQLTFLSTLTNFSSNPTDLPKDLPCLITAHIDESANFIIASDLRRKALYVIELGELENGRIRLFKSIQELLLTESLLSFDINTVSSMPTQDGCQQIVIKLCTITKSAFQKMKISYLSSGHRMSEIQESMKKKGFGSNGSLITQISSLQPSVNHSLQDPAIIATEMPPPPSEVSCSTKGVYQHDSDRNDGDDEDDDDESTNLHNNDSVPVTLKHLFASASSNMSPITSGLLINGSSRMSVQQSGKEESVLIRSSGDSGDESGDEASLHDGDMTSFQQKSGSGQSQSAQNNGVNSTGGGGINSVDFPIPPPSCDQDDDGGSSLLQRQQFQIQALSNQLEMMREQITELHQTVSAIYSKPSPPITPPEIVLDETIVNRISHQTAESLGDHISQDVSSRLSTELRNQLTTIVTPVLKDSIGKNLQDKHTIQIISDNVSNTTGRIVKSVISDIVKQEFTPKLSTMIDRLIQDTGTVIKDSVSEVMKSLDHSSKSIQKQINEKILDQSKKDNNNWQSNFQKLTSDMNGWRSEIKSSINQQALAQTRIIDSLRDLKETMVTNQQNMRYQYDSDNQLLNRGQSMTSLLNNQSALDSPSEKVRRETPESLISQNILQENYVTALKIALDQTNLPLLLHTLTKISLPNRVLSSSPNKPSQLPVTSILALLQQLSREFSSHFEIKFEFLFEAVMSLPINSKKSPSSSLSNANMSKVLSGMNRRLQTHLEHEQNSLQKDRVKILIRIVNSKLEALQD